MKTKWNLNDEDYDELLICAVRYALGRRTYVVDDVCTMVRNNRKNISNNTLSVIIRDIIDFGRNNNHEIDLDSPAYGDECDLNDWMQTLSQLQIEDNIRHGRQVCN